MKTLATCLSAAAAIVATAGTAVAQDPVYVEDSEAPALYVREPIGIGLTLGGGISGFTSETLRDTTTAGGSWTVRATFGTTMPVAFEASYLGSAQSIDALGLDSDAILVSNGAQGALRLNANPGMPIDPFIYGGLAWRRYDLLNTDTNTSAITSDDDVFEFPIGVGVAARSGGFLFDVRGEFRFAQEEDLVPELDAFNRDLGDSADMHRWGVNATIGYEL